MSWLSTNYEKAALGGSAVIAIGLVWLGWSKFSAVSDELGAKLSGRGKSDPAVVGAELIPKALQSLKLDRSWQQSRAAGERPVNLFTGISLFVASSAPDKAIDLLSDPPVHPPIPNVWWIENRLDPGYANSPLLDPDNDGFSNLEEFTASTNPYDPNSHPPLVAKLTYLKDQSITWVIRPGYGSEGKFPFNYEDNQGRRNRITAAEMIGPDEVFFKQEPAKERFKLLGAEIRKEVNPRTNIEMDITMVRIEDLRHNKKGTVYEFPSPLQDDNRRIPYLKHDRSAVLSLEAIGFSGQEFTIEENTAFALPPNAPSKEYHLKSVTPDAIVVEYTDLDGSRKTAEIAKGGFPNLAP
jgi:hypothetical protein